MNTPTYHVHHTHEYIHHTKWNHTLTNDYSTLSQSVLSLDMKMFMPLPTTRDILVCDSTNRTLLELTTQTKTQQLPEVYVKVVHSAVHKRDVFQIAVCFMFSVFEFQLFLLVIIWFVLQPIATNSNQ